MSLHRSASDRGVDGQELELATAASTVANKEPASPSSVTYMRGDSDEDGLWNDNELIRLWNEQLEARNVKSMVSYRVIDSLSDEESSANDGAVGDEDSHDDDDDDARRGRLDGKNMENRANTVNGGRRAHEAAAALSDASNSSGDARRYHHTRRHKRPRGLTELSTSGLGLPLSSSFESTDGTHTMAPPYMDSLPRDVHALVKSFYKAGLEVGLYIARHRRCHVERHKHGSE